MYSSLLAKLKYIMAGFCNIYWKYNGTELFNQAYVQLWFMRIWVREPAVKSARLLHSNLKS